MATFKHGTKIDSKNYLTISAGPLRGKRVHVLVAETMLGRKLRIDETIHHRNLCKLDPSPANLKVLGRADHGAVSNRQRWFLKQKFALEEREWADWLRWIEEGGERPGSGSAGGAPAADACATSTIASGDDDDATEFNPEDFHV